MSKKRSSNACSPKAPSLHLSELGDVPQLIFTCDMPRVLIILCYPNQIETRIGEAENLYYLPKYRLGQLILLSASIIGSSANGETCRAGPRTGRTILRFSLNPTVQQN